MRLTLATSTASQVVYLVAGGAAIQNAGSFGRGLTNFGFDAIDASG
jgi:hypothetical protein